MQRSLSAVYSCIFCGHSSPAEKYYWSDKLSKIEANVPMQDGSSAGAGVILTPHPRAKTYYDCSGCSIKYEDISDISIETLFRGLRVEPLVTDEIRRLYEGRVDLETLIRKYRTGIGKKARHADGFLNAMKSKRKVMVGILYGSDRIFVSFIKEKKPHEHYAAVSVGRPLP